MEQDAINTLVEQASPEAILDFLRTNAGPDSQDVTLMSVDDVTSLLDAGGASLNCRLSPVAGHESPLEPLSADDALELLSGSDSKDESGSPPASVRACLSVGAPSFKQNSPTDARTARRRTRTHTSGAQHHRQQAQLKAQTQLKERTTNAKRKLKQSSNKAQANIKHS